MGHFTVSNCNSSTIWMVVRCRANSLTRLRSTVDAWTVNVSKRKIIIRLLTIRRFSTPSGAYSKIAKASSRGSFSIGERLDWFTSSGDDSICENEMPSESFARFGGIITTPSNSKSYSTENDREDNGERAYEWSREINKWSHRSQPSIRHTHRVRVTNKASVHYTPPDQIVSFNYRRAQDYF